MLRCLAFALGERLQDVAEIFMRHIDVKIFERLEQGASSRPLKMTSGRETIISIAFATHLFDDDGDLHFAAGFDLEMRRRFRCRRLDAKRSRASRGSSARAHGARSQIFLRARRAGRSLTQIRIAIVGGSISTNDSGSRSSRVGDRFADENVLEAGQPNDVAGARVLDFDLLNPSWVKSAVTVRPLAAAVACDADHRIADRHATADDAPERDPPEVIAVIEIRHEHLEKWLVGNVSAAAHVARSLRKAASCLRCFSWSSRIANPSFALA